MSLSELIQQSFNGITFNKDRHTGYYLSTRRVDGKRRKRIHVYVWEFFNGPIPKGYHVHHKDLNKDNNDISNLDLMSPSEHSLYHGAIMTEDRKCESRKNIIEKATPAAVLWHKSKEGKEWHKKHGKESWIGRDYLTYNCSFCGKEFKSRHSYGEGANHFCSNNCRAAFRRRRIREECKAKQAQ